MGILGIFKQRTSTPKVEVRTPVEPEIVTRLQQDSEWRAPDGLDPHQANLAKLMFRMREEAAELTSAQAVAKMGRPFGFESEALVPLPGAGRHGWSDRKTFEALNRDGDYMTAKGDASPRVLDAIDREVVRRLADEPGPVPNLPERTYALRADVTGRVSDFMKEGPRLDERVAVESEMLERQNSGIIQDRFRDMPIASFRPMPDRGEARRAWIEDTLRAEHAAAREGLLSPTGVVHAASQRRGPVPIVWGPAPVIADRTKEAQAEVSVEAARIEKLSEASLRLRFRDVPGSAEAVIPDAARGDDRRTWVEAALMAHKVREGMPRSSPSQVGHGKAPIALPFEVGQSAQVQGAGRDHDRQAATHTFAVAAMLGR